MTFGEKLRILRKNQHITQEQLAELLNVSTQNISSWECDKYYPSTDRLEYIASALNTSVGYLMNNTYNNKNWTLRDEMFTTENMYTKVSQQIILYNLQQCKEALPYVMNTMKNYMRKGSGDVPYVNHPLMMAMHAFSLGITDDNTIATILLHSIYRNCGISPDDLPLPINNTVKDALQLLYYNPQYNKNKSVIKEAYYQQITNNSLASIVRVIDQCNKISTITFGFPKEKLYGYIEDTEVYVLPLLNYIEKNYLNYYNITFLLKYQILSVIESLKRLLD